MKRQLRALGSRSAKAVLTLAFLGWVFDELSFRSARARRGRRRLRSYAVGERQPRGLVLEAGSGEPVLILASPLVLARSYLPLLQRLSLTHRVMVMELPGTGCGSRRSDPWSFDDYADWVSTWLDRMDSGSVVLIGHSNSGPIALRVARHSTRIARLILVDSVGTRWPLGIARIVFARAIDALKEPLLDWRAWWHLVYNLMEHTRNFLHQVWLAGTHWERAPLLVDVPTVVAWGVRDGTLPLAAAVRLTESLLGARLVVGPGSHDWLITHSRDFVRLVFQLKPAPTSS